MRLDTLNERIANAKAKIEKKTATIEKKKALIEKKKVQIAKLGFDPENIEDPRATSDLWWLVCDIGHLEEDIDRGAGEIEETKKSLEKYEAQLAGEIEKESVLIKDIPESMKRLQTELVERWDAWDIERRERIKKDRSEMDYKAFCKKYNRSERLDFIYKTDEQIHNSNMQDAKCLILNLYYRVKDITGEVTDWHGITLDIGTHGFPILSGLVIGKEGRAIVESIYAGGYNIQRLHIRVLVHGF